MKFLKSCAMLAVVLAALCLLFVPAQAAEIVASGDCGAEGSNVTWTLDADGLLTISGTGAMETFTFKTVPWGELTESVKQVVIQPGVTTISDYAFYCCNALDSISIPEGVTSIGQWAFSSCNALKTVDIPAGVTEIGVGAFNGSGIVSLEIPYGVTTIRGSTFGDCMELTSVSIPNSVTTIEGSVFYWCSSLKSLTIPDSVTSLGESMCAMCDHLEYVYIGKGITENDPAKFSTIFNYCGSLKKFEVSPENPVYCTDEYGVLFNKDMTELIQAPAAMTGIYYVPDGVVTLRAMAFCRNNGLTGVVLSDSVREIGSWSFGYNDMTQVTLNEGLTTIAETAFRYSEKLESIVIPGTVTEIGTYTFQFCRSLKSVTLGEGITYLPEYMFQECTALEEITIPASVTSIESGAFSYCTNLKTIHYAGSQFQWNLLPKSNSEIDSKVTVLTHTHSFSGNTCTQCGVPIGSIGDGLTWVVYNGSTLAFEGEGAIPGYSLTSPAPWYSLRKDIQKLVFDSSVSDIGDYAFYGFENITKITIPTQATYIGDHAFDGCATMTIIFVPGQVVSVGEYAFANCASVESVSLGSSVSSVGDYAFANCTNLGVVSLGEKVRFIGYRAFSNCPQISTYHVDYNNPYYAEYHVSGSTEYPWLFTKDLTTVVLSTQTVSGNIKIPYGITTIADGAFAECGNITGITLPDTVTAIGQYVFVNCTSLEHIIYVGTEAQWQQVSVGENNENITSDMIFCTASHGHTLYDGQCTGCGVWGGTCGAEGGNLNWTLDVYGNMHIFGTGAMTDFSSYTTTPWNAHRSKIQFVTIDPGITTIGKNAFAHATQLKTISIPDTITSVASNAFYCASPQYAISNNGKYLGNGDNPYLVLMGMTSSCTTFEVHSATKLIGPYAFSSIVESITISASVTYIDENAFSNKNKLTAILVDEENPWYCNDASGVLFNKDMTRLIQAPAFLLTSYTIPDSVTTISKNAFINGSPLKSVYIGTNLRVFEGNSFQYCHYLTVYYMGTQEQWQQIENYASITAKKQYNACSITLQPQDLTVKKGEYAQFAVEAIGLDLTYQWQFSRDGGKTWNNSSAATAGYNTNTLTVVATEVRNGFMYRCVIKDELGYAMTSDAAQLTVEEPFAIVSQPASKTVEYGSSTVFAVEATGIGLTYQWQYSMNGGKSWFNSTAATQGYNTDTLTVVGAQNRDGFLYRCRITDSKGEKLYTEAATLTVDTSSMPRFTAQPASQTVTAGGKTQFTAAFTGEYSRVYWQYSINGGKSWYASSFTGCDTDTLTVEAKNFRDGFMYRCVLIDAYGNRIVSNAATLTVDTSAMPWFTAQPASQAVTAGGKTVFTAAFTGEYSRVYWEYSINGGKSWYASSFTGCDTDTLTVEAKNFRDGFMYRCVLIDAYGNRIVSNAATLTVQ